MSTQRVSREDLRSSVSSPPSSPRPALEELLRAKLNATYGFDFNTSPNQPTPVPGDAVSSDEDEAELRLFAAPLSAASTKPTTLKIRLSSPGAQNEEPSMIRKKPRSYYFVDELTSDAKAAFQAAAIEGKTVLELSQQPWPGCALPWKVRNISATGIKKNVLVGQPPDLVTVEEKAQKRTRKNKKTRIAIRKKLQATKARQSERERMAQEKEEAEREKRTRRNREKKLKKKARDQAKKVAAGDGGQENQDNDSDVNKDLPAQD